MPGSGREEEKWRKKGRREEMVGKNGSKRWKDCLSFLPTHSSVTGYQKKKNMLASYPGYVKVSVEATHIVAYKLAHERCDEIVDP